MSPLSEDGASTAPCAERVWIGRALLPLFVVVSMACSATEAPGSSAGAGRGPLVLPDGFIGVMAPTARRAYMTVDTCLEGPGAHEVELTDVAAVGGWSPAELQWKVMWPSDADARVAGSAYGAVPDNAVGLPSSGQVNTCDEPSGSPWLVVQFPRATSAHIGFDSIRVRYSTEAGSYEADYDVSLGVCAKGVPAPPAQCGGR